MTTTRTAWCAKCNGPVLCDKGGCIACAQKRERDRLLRTNAPLHASCGICGGTYGLHRDQLETGGPVFTICANCEGEVEAQLDAKRKLDALPRGGGRGQAGDHGPRRCYAPIDETASNMRFALLRTIRHFDWATSAQLADAMGIPPWDVDKHRRNYFDHAITHLTKAGHIERTGDRMSFAYRITTTGLREYETQIARSMAA